MIHNSQILTTNPDIQFQRVIMEKVKIVVLLLLFSTLVSPRHFNCDNVCGRAGRGHSVRPSGTGVRFNVFNSSPFVSLCFLY